MGIELWVIKPEHYQQYNGDTYAFIEDFHLISIRDEWYKDTENHYLYHQIWNNWQKGYYEDDFGRLCSLPKDLNNFFYSFTCPILVKNIIIELKKLDTSEINRFVEWVQFWIDRGAYFHLDL